MKRRIVIIGGGLAGLAAALRLADDEQYEVILLETRKKLGGRATSFQDVRTGEVFDNCQHVLMGCCTNLIDLYHRLDVLDKIRWHRRLYWWRGNARPDVMKAGPLPAPLHFTGSFLRMRLFDRAEKKAVARAMHNMLRMGRPGRLAWSDQPFSEFLEKQGQPERVVRLFWNTIIVSACNLPVDRVCAAHALQVFQEGFLATRWSYMMGLAVVPLYDLYDPAVERICAAGGDVRLGCAAKAIAYDGKRVTGVVTTDGSIEAAAVIAAVPFDRLAKLTSETMQRADLRLQHLAEMDVSPILGVHLLFDRKVMDLPHLIVPDRGLQWLFNKGVDEDGSQYVHAVISAADEWMTLKEGEILERVIADVREAVPAAQDAELLAGRPVKEKRATFAAVPGVDEFRPRAAPGTVGLGGGGIPNLFLAGDWCDTGWPATMEGAVRSGYAAAGAIMQRDLLVEDLEPARLARWMGLK